jgi:hypothetical protein
MYVKEIFYSLLPTALATYLGLVFIGFWFNEEKSFDSGLGFYNANLNSLLNPKSSDVVWSRIIPQMKQATEGQYEGFGFLGISFFLIIICLGIFQTRFNFKNLLTTVKNHKLLAISTIFSVILATGFKFYLGVEVAAA